MEDNQLNFNQPLLSVRRYSLTLVSEKEDRKNLKSQPDIPTRLPHYKSDVKSGSIRNPGAVPFVWEQSPGKRKDGNRPQIDYSERPSTAPKLPPGRIPKPDQQESDNALVLHTAEKIQVANSRFSHDNPVKDMNDAEDPITEDESSDSSNDEVYVDALDTLSRTESFFLNCSVSGVSGFEDVPPPGAFSTDPQAKDFMIGRFLPAAKAMASESPQITQPKKQPIVPDEPRQPKKVVNSDKGPQLRYGPSFAKQHAEAEYYNSGEEDSDDDFDDSEMLQAKVCGLVPRFFLKGSHCLLNRIPARSVRTAKPPLSPASREGTVSSASSWSKTEHEHSSFDTSERKSMDGSLTIELHEEKNDLNMKTEHISTKLEGTYPHESIQQAGESKYTSNADLNSPGTGYKSFKDMLSDKNSSEDVDSGCTEVEKTVYVDSVRKFHVSTQKDLCPPSVAPRNIQDHDYSKKGSAIRNESGGFNKGDKRDTNLPKFPDFKFLALRTDVPKGFGQDQNSDEEAKVKFNEKALGINSKKQILEAEDLENIGGGIFPDFSIPPPLPKSPSDSWLWRTLPSISSKNSSSHPYFGIGPGPRYQGFMTSDDIKEENMFKTSKTQELLAPIPEN